MKANKYVEQIIRLNEECVDRGEFHKRSGNLLKQMSGDLEFWTEVFKRNLTDKEYLNRKWTMYEIPFFYVYECDDFYLKVHLFTPLKTHEPGVMASAIHHHNNYILTTYAAFGSGYEAMLFEKDFRIDKDTKQVNLRIREHFTQQQKPLHTVDAWEPHVVINPTSLSATLVLWSPDKKRATDSLRSNPILKALKTPLRKIIYALKMDKAVGIAAEKTYQFFVKDKKFYAILEDEYFAPTRAQAGEHVNEYSVQTLFSLMQQMGFKDMEFISGLKNNAQVPKYYHKWIDHILNGTQIEETYAKEWINIPGGRAYVKDILDANMETSEI